MMDTSKLCRSCMEEVASWENANFDPRAEEMFYFCTNIKMILNDDKLPKQFCYNCLTKIKSSYTFITEAQKVDSILKNIISTATSTIFAEKTYTNVIDFDNIGTVDCHESCIDNNDIRSETEGNINSSKGLQNKKERQDKQNSVSDKELNNIGDLSKHVCPLCCKEFKSKLWFDKHMYKEHKGPKLICEHCQKAFTRKWELEQHLYCHSDVRKYSCSDCGKGFKRLRQLTMHALAHTELRPFECDKCGMKEIAKQNTLVIMTHLSRVVWHLVGLVDLTGDGQQSTHACAVHIPTSSPAFKIVFKLKDILKAHMSVHDGEKPHLCSICGWRFARAGNLSVHMRQHTGDKPYSCDECNFRAAVPSTLKCHQRRHQLLRSHVCNHCSKGFYDASGLVRHVRTHTGELPYSCPACARTFADSWKRKSHLMRAHGLALADIPRMDRAGRSLS